MQRAEAQGRQAVLDYKLGSTISDLIQSASSSDSLGNFVERYRGVKSDTRSRYVDSEAAINRRGYTLLGKKRTAYAIEVLKLNTEYYPASANVYDSLGDALAAAGRTDEAIKSYEKAVRSILIFKPLSTLLEG